MHECTVLRNPKRVYRLAEVITNTGKYARSAERQATIP
jgi:hypothetical protein